MEKKTFVAMKAIILNENNEVLIVQESSKDPTRSHIGKWDLPGGRLEFGEDPVEGLKREIKEEVGLEVEIEKPVDISYWMPKKNEEEWYIVALFMICKPLSTEVKISNFEHEAFKWSSLHDLEEGVLPEAKRVLGKLVTNE